METGGRPQQPGKPAGARADAQPSRQRLFVGGLHQEVTGSDLRERFGRFGRVPSVDLRTKRDAEGMPTAGLTHPASSSKPRLIL